MVAYRRALAASSTSEHEPRLSEYHFAFGYDLGSTHKPHRICFTKLLLAEDPETSAEDVWNGLEPTKESVLLRLLQIGRPDSEVRPSIDLDISSDKYKLQIDTALGKVLSDIFYEALGATKDVIEGGHKLKSPEYRFMITVPAIWPDEAITKTFRAAEEAGFGPSIYTISEPEAAMHQIINDNEQLGRLEKGDVCIVCDGGGGTIDIISHEVVSTNPFRLREAAVGVGQRGGGVHLDAGFFALLSVKLGKETYEKHRNDSGCLTTWQSCFERIKNLHARSNIRHADYVVDAPHISVHESVEFSVAEVNKQYDVEIAKIIEMLDNQIDALKAQDMKAKYICLVGGFGSSTYVQEMLQESYQYLTVVQSLRPHTAVVEGAVRALLNPSFIASRKARDHIGVLCEKPMNTKTAVRDELTEQNWAPDQVTVLVKRGDDLSVVGENTREEEFFETVRAKRDISTEYDIWFMISRRSRPPREFSNNSLHDNPTSKEEWFRLRVDLTRYEEHFQTMNEGTARQHLRLDFKINVRYAGSSLVFHLEIDGKEVESLAKKYFTPDEKMTALSKSTHRLSNKRARPEKSSLSSSQ
mgnify:FL=1